MRHSETSIDVHCDIEGGNNMENLYKLIEDMLKRIKELEEEVKELKKRY